MNGLALLNKSLFKANKLLFLLKNTPLVSLALFLFPLLSLSFKLLLLLLKLGKLLLMHFAVDLKNAFAHVYFVIIKRFAFLGFILILHKISI